MPRHLAEELNAGTVLRKFPPLLPNGCPNDSVLEHRQLIPKAQRMLSPGVTTLSAFIAIM